MSCRGGKSALLVDDAGWATPGSTRASSERRIPLRSNQAAPLTVDANGPGTYRLTVDHGLVAGDGTFTSVVTATSTVNSGRHQRGDAEIRRPTLRAADRHRDEPRRELDRYERGRREYDYAFNGVDAGQYWIYAGSDSDNDDRICDAGEARGAFRTLNAPQVLTINGDRTDIDFISGFPLNLFNLTNSPNFAGPFPIQRLPASESTAGATP